MMSKCNLGLDRRFRGKSFLLLSDSIGKKCLEFHGGMRWYGLNRTFRHVLMWARGVVDLDEVLLLAWKYRSRETDLCGQRNGLGK